MFKAITGYHHFSDQIWFFNLLCYLKKSKNWDYALQVFNILPQPLLVFLVITLDCSFNIHIKFYTKRLTNLAFTASVIDSVIPENILSTHNTSEWIFLTFRLVKLIFVEFINVVGDHSYLYNYTHTITIASKVDTCIDFL